MSDSSLTVGERRKLADLEETIERGMHSFVDVGNALVEIQKGKLYTDVGDTFEAYCKKRWGFAKSHTYRLIDSAKVVTLLEKSPIGDSALLPQNEAQARILAELPDERTQATVWAKAVETARKDANGSPIVTAAHVAKVAKEAAKNGSVSTNVDTKPKEPKPVTDADGNPVPLALQPLFKRAAEFEKLCTQLSDIAKAVGALAEEAIGVHLHEQSIIADLNNVKQAIRFAKPYGVCPYCKGGGKYKGDKCSSCKGVGFVGRSKLKAAPAEMRA